MKVRILSGNQAGDVVEQEQSEAESNIASGFAEAVVEVPALLVAEVVEKVVKRSGREKK